MFIHWTHNQNLITWTLTPKQWAMIPKSSICLYFPLNTTSLVKQRVMFVAPLTCTLTLKQRTMTSEMSISSRFHRSGFWSLDPWSSYFGEMCHILLPAWYDTRSLNTISKRKTHGNMVFQDVELNESIKTSGIWILMESSLCFFKNATQRQIRSMSMQFLSAGTDVLKST